MVEIPPVNVELLTVPQAAAVMQVSERKAYGLISAGIVPSLRVGASIRVPRTALQAWIEREAREAREAVGAV